MFRSTGPDLKAASLVERPNTLTRSGEDPNVIGDSIATYDRAQRRVTVFSRSGIRARRVIIASPGNGWGPEALALLDDGRILVQATRAIGAETAASLLMPGPLAVASLVAIRDSSVCISDSADAPIREVSMAGADVRRFGARSATRTPSLDLIGGVSPRRLRPPAPEFIASSNTRRRPHQSSLMQSLQPLVIDRTTSASAVLPLRKGAEYDGALG